MLTRALFKRTPAEDTCSGTSSVRGPCTMTCTTCTGNKRRDSHQPRHNTIPRRLGGGGGVAQVPSAPNLCNATRGTRRSRGQAASDSGATRGVHSNRAKRGRGRVSSKGVASAASKGRMSAAQGGVFAQRGHSAGTAPIITVIIQVTTLKTTHLRNHAQSIQNSKIQTSDACHGSQGPKFCPL